MEFELLTWKRGLQTVLDRIGSVATSHKPTVSQAQPMTAGRSSRQDHRAVSLAPCYNWSRISCVTEANLNLAAFYWMGDGRGGSTVKKEEKMGGSHQPKSPALLAPPTQRRGDTLSLRESRIPVPQPASQEACRKRQAFGLVVVSENLLPLVALHSTANPQVSSTAISSFS